MLILLAALLAAVPEKGEGTIAALGGVRTIFPANNGYLDEQLGSSHQPIQLGGLASFGYQYDEELHFKIEVGYLRDKYKIPGDPGDLSVVSIPLLLGLDTALWRGDAFTLYGGGGIGYSLNTGTRGGASNEANSTAGYLALGLRLRLGGPLALVVEDRWTLASAQVDAGNSKQTLNVGGNLLSIGLMVHWMQAEDHPRVPHDD
jgi:Outer membrane protein beta-barrel domain